MRHISTSVDTLISRIWDSGPRSNLMSMSFTSSVSKKLLCGVPLVIEESLDPTFFKTSVHVQWQSTLSDMWKWWGGNLSQRWGESRRSTWILSFINRMAQPHIAQMFHWNSSNGISLEIGLSRVARTIHGRHTPLHCRLFPLGLSKRECLQQQSANNRGSEGKHLSGNSEDSTGYVWPCYHKLQCAHSNCNSEKRRMDWARH